MKKEKKKRDSFSGDIDQLQSNNIVDVSQTPMCATFPISRPCTIHSDAKPHKVNIANIQLEAEYEYVVVPSLSLYAYLKALTLNSSPFILLPGKMSIFIDNFFVSSADLKLTSPGEKMELYLGIDGNIKVEHTKTPQQHGKKGNILKKNKTRTVAHITTIKNTKPETIKITVLEQLPTTKDNKVRIDILQPENKEEYSITERHNLVKWDLTMDPREEKKIPFSYIIEFPDNKRIEVIEKKE